MPPKLATRSSLENVVILDDILARQGGCTMPEMCSRLDCCEKTVRRHLNWMQRKFGSRFTRYKARDSEWWTYRDGSMVIFTDEAKRRFR